MRGRRISGINAAGLVAAALLLGVTAAPTVSAKDWSQWCGSDGKNMVSQEHGLPASFSPGRKRGNGTIDLSTAVNVKWGVNLGDAFYSTPTVVGGRLYLGGLDDRNGTFTCLDAATGRRLWQLRAPPRDVPHRIDGFSIGISDMPQDIGVCSTTAVEAGRVYFVSNRFEVICLDAAGSKTNPGEARVLWTFDMWKRLGVFPCDVANGSPLIVGDLLYVPTSNGVDRNTFGDPASEKHRKIPAPAAPSLIALDKRDGRLVATDDTPIMRHILHGQWSAPSLAVVAGRKLVIFGGGDGICYAFDALASVPEKPVRLKTVWSCDCIPPEYKSTGGREPIDYYCLGDKRVRGTLNKNDGKFVGRSEIIATPVFVNDRVYIAIGRDPAHGRGRGALHCIDPRPRRHHRHRQVVDVPGPRPHALDRLGGRGAALHLQRRRPAALPRRFHRQMPLGPRDEVRSVGIDPRGRRQGLHADVPRPMGAGGRQNAEGPQPNPPRRQGLLLAGRRQRYDVCSHQRRLAVGGEKTVRQCLVGNP